MQTGKIIKRIFLTIGIILGLFIITAILVPILFKDKIMALVKKELNEQLNATADFKDVDLSLFRSFPSLSVSIEGLSIANKAPFQGDTLISAKSIDVSLDLMKAIKGTYDITNIGLIDPRIHALVNKKGEANWNITKPTPPTTPAAPSKPFAIKLRHYAIENAFIEYRDEQATMSCIIENLTHKGSGDFSSDAFTLKTTTVADAISFAYGNIPYLYKVKTSIDLDIDIDNKTNKYSFNTEKIQLNGLRLSTKGFVQLPDSLNTLMDVQFSTPSNDFKDILSLVPGIYQNNFKDIKTSGKASLSGYVKGTYNAKKMPAYSLNLSVTDGSFQYPDLPQKVSDIQVKLLASNPDGITDHTEVDIEKAHLVFGSAPFDLRMLLKNPISNPWTDATAKGIIDLSQMGKFMKLPDGTKLTGVIKADVSFKGPIMAATRQHYDSVYAAGTVGITDLNYASKDYPDGVSITNLLLTFNPRNVTVSGLKGQYMKTNFTGDGSINNLLGYYLHNEALNGSLNLTIDKMDVNKWMGTPSSTETKTAPSTTAFLVPANLDLSLHAQAGEIKYDNLVLTSVSGGLAIKDETVYLQNLTGKGLDGTLKIDGYYSTKNDKKNPDISLSYDVQNLDITKTFTTFNTVQKMMPAAKYMSGKMTTKLNLKGKIGPDMMPVLNSLTGDGNLLVLEGLLSNFAPTNMLADKLNLSQFRNISLKDLKIFFSFENGRVTVKPYNFKIGDIAAEIAGSHGFDQSINYGANFTVPRSMLGTQGNAMLNDLVNKATAKGIPVNLGDKINFAATIGGTLTSPKIETNLKNVAGDAVNNVKQQIVQEAQKKIDSVKNIVKDTAKAIKTQLVNDAKQQLQNQILQNKKDSTQKSQNTLNDAKKKAEEKAKGALKNIFK